MSCARQYARISGLFSSFGGDDRTHMGEVGDDVSTGVGGVAVLLCRFPRLNFGGAASVTDSLSGADGLAVTMMHIERK